MKYDQSIQAYARACESLAGGVSSQFRSGGQPCPLFFDRGEGPYLWDFDGNRYIDYALGQGPAVLGHAPQPVIAAVADSLSQGQIFASQTLLEVEVAERVCELVPCAERVRFSSTGSEVVQAALRLARATTGRSRFVKFEGHYHGWFDNVAISIQPALDAAGPADSPCAVAWTGGQRETCLDDAIVLPWNDDEAVAAALAARGSEIAAVIMEPIMCNSGCILPRPGYLEQVRELCDRHGVFLIFDEVITGFRVAPGGAQAHFGITPDVATFGKAMAAGFPVSALAGTAAAMEGVASGKAIHAGTLNANVPCMAATKAALAALTADGNAVYTRLGELGEHLMDGIRDHAARHGITVQVQGPGPMFHVAIGAAEPLHDYRSSLRCDRDAYARFCYLMQERGVRLIGRGLWYVSAAHSDADVESTLCAVDESLAALAR